MHIKWAWMRLSTTLRNDALQTDVNKWRAAKKIRPTHQYALKPKSRRSRALHVMAFDLEFMIVVWTGLNQADKQKTNSAGRTTVQGRPRTMPLDRIVNISGYLQRAQHARYEY